MRSRIYFTVNGQKERCVEVDGSVQKEDSRCYESLADHFNSSPDLPDISPILKDQHPHEHSQTMLRTIREEFVKEKVEITRVELVS